MGWLIWSYQLLCLQLLLFQSLSYASPCSHDQSSALLQFKQLFSLDELASDLYVKQGYPYYPKTEYWKEGTDCCSWDGVTCDTMTGNVIDLDLSCSQLYGSIPSNSSLFRLSHLQRLDLAFNHFSSSYIDHFVSLDLSSNGVEIETPVLEGLVRNVIDLKELILDDTELPTYS
ncbi:hypothetical protein JRO89_XS15G0032000 [Xanthoceras sorbifolium]|uniref:Leucine-rich repeat-containing N-terminal plant-type domain-containing protein n=1 Tax=Xanthoceras sorbifolium TaxID=99658 RepID=A0ABQ8H0Y8_9ROSI|nr:hypothetical protein JRO89_XS15G0032000 [Xanthoceras sorbifolium]